jgi:heme/copper-type cytochrome/quinol oxidase subunit 3
VSEPRPAPPALIDVSRLPTTVFGRWDLGWWGTMGFAVIEGVTLFICLVAYLYVRQNFDQWPPPGTRPPDVAPFAAQAGLMLLSWLPARRMDLAARRFDAPSVRRWLALLAVLVIAFMALRVLELRALDTRWDADAYGTTTWILLLMHGSLIVVEIGEVLVMLAILSTSRATERHCSDASDVTAYWYFLTGSWIVLAAILVLWPRL